MDTYPGFLLSRVPIEGKKVLRLEKKKYLVGNEYKFDLKVV